MASSLDRGVEAFGKHFIDNLSETLNSLADGAGRMAGKGVCLFLTNNETCDQLNREDLRMAICTWEFVKHIDAIASMLYLCICYIIQRYNEKQQIIILLKVIYFYSKCYNTSSPLCDILDLDSAQLEEIMKDFHDPLKRDDTIERLTGTSIDSIISEVQKLAIGFAARKATEKVTDKTTEMITSYVITKYAAGSEILGVSIAAVLSRFKAVMAGFLSSYSLVSKAAGTAERLRMCNRKLYHLLYVNNLEMFFFLLEDFLPNSIFYGDYAFQTEEEAIIFLRKLIR